MIAEIKNVYVRRTILVLWCIVGEPIALASVVIADAYDYLRDEVAPGLRDAWRGPSA